MARCAAELQRARGLPPPAPEGGGRSGPEVQAEVQRGRGAVSGAPGGPRRVVFAAASAEVREAYRKALLALGSPRSKQQSGAVSPGLCPAYGVRQ